MELAVFKIHIKKKVDLCYGISWILETPTNLWIGLQLLSPLVVLKVLKAL